MDRFGCIFQTLNRERSICVEMCLLFFCSLNRSICLLPCQFTFFRSPASGFPASVASLLNELLLNAGAAERIRGLGPSQLTPEPLRLSVFPAERECHLQHDCAALRLVGAAHSPRGHSAPVRLISRNAGVSLRRATPPVPNPPPHLSRDSTGLSKWKL